MRENTGRARNPGIYVVNAGLVVSASEMERSILTGSEGQFGTVMGRTGSEPFVG